VIAAASTDDKLAFCREHGATDVSNYAREDLKDRIKALTSGNGVNVVYDPIGGSYAEAGAARQPRGRAATLVIGFASGEIPKIPLNLVLLKGCQIVGVYWGSFAMRDPARNRDHANKVLGWSPRASCARPSTPPLPFERAGEALERLEKRLVKGKLVLVALAPLSLALAAVSARGEAASDKRTGDCAGNDLRPCDPWRDDPDDVLPALPGSAILQACVRASWCSASWSAKS